MKERQIKALANTGIFHGKLLQGTLEETHISWVILTARFAFKLKKPLRLSFLDFSTLARRKKYCEREVQLNRRLSGIYLAVVPVKYNKEVWRLGSGAGKILDYAVQMKRMKSNKRMDFLLQAGKVTHENILSLAKSIANFHAHAKIISTPFDKTFSREAFNDIRVIKPFALKTLGRRYALIISRSIPWSNAFLNGHAKHFQERIAQGFKRDVHGDLHSGNIFLYNRPVIFDCIEFNDDYRQIDVINEVAFFCMDLEAFGHKRLAEIFMKEYTRLFPCFQTGEDEKTFDYFKCYRANVRAKVHAMAAAQENDQGIYRRHVEAVKKYLKLVEGYTIKKARL